MMFGKFRNEIKCCPIELFLEVKMVGFGTLAKSFL